MKAARAWGVRPTRYLAKWSKRDRGLAEGLLTYEADLNELGTPSWIARDSGRKFAPDEVGYDYQLAAMQEYHAQQRKSDDGKTYGLLVAVKEVTPHHPS